MALTQLFLLVFCTVLVTGVSSSIVPDLSGLTQADLLQKLKDLGVDEDLTYIKAYIKRLGYTVEEIVKIYILLKDVETNTRAALVSRCSVLVSSNFTLAEGDPRQNISFKILTRLSKSMDAYEGEEAPFYKNVFCSYASHPTEHVKHAEALGLAMLPYFKFEHIRKRNNNNRSVQAATELCDAFWSGDNIADLKLKSNSVELTENQLGEFKKLWNEIEYIDWDKSPRLVVENLCNLLNIKTTAEEQANVLGITVNAYSNFLNGLKEFSKDNSTQGRLDIYRQMCREINLSLGYSRLFVSQNETLTEEQIERFSGFTLDVEFADHERIRLIKGICLYLNESVTIKYIAENAGLSDYQLAQYNHSIMSFNMYYFLRHYFSRQLLLARNLCKVINSDKVRENAIFHNDYDTVLQLNQFILKTSKIFLSSVNERLELLRGACLTSFPQLYTVEE